MTSGAYVHGYDPREQRRLSDQAQTLAELLHADTRYAAGSRVLEAGCGVGAQSVHLAAGSPEALITSMDISAESVAAASRRAEQAGLANVSFRVGDILHPPFEPGSFDHVFVCFVLEHLADPAAALASLGRLLVPGGTLTVIEGDHGSTFFHPDSPRARRAVQALVDAQRLAGGGDANIGRRLFPLLSGCGLVEVRVSPRLVYVDDSMPHRVQGFTLDTFTSMVAGARPQVAHLELMDMAEFDAGVADLAATAAGGGTFCYCFFKATAVKP